MPAAHAHPQFDLWIRPVTVDYYGMDWKQAEAFLQEFKRRIPERLAALERNVRSTPGFEDWSLDYSPESFERLGAWFLRVGTTERENPEDRYFQSWNPNLSEETVRELTKIVQQDADWDLTNEAKAIGVDIGIYCGEAVRRRYPSMRWIRCKARCSCDQNFPLLWTKANMGGNPMVEPNDHARAMMRKHPSFQRGFRGLYENWMERAAFNEQYRLDRLAKDAQKRAKGRRK